MRKYWLIMINAIDRICNNFKGNDIHYSMVTNMSVLNDKIKEVVINFNITITTRVDDPKNNEIDKLTENIRSMLGMEELNEIIFN